MAKPGSEPVRLLLNYAGIEWRFEPRSSASIFSPFLEPHCFQFFKIGFSFYNDYQQRVTFYLDERPSLEVGLPSWIIVQSLEIVLAVPQVRAL